MKRTIYLFTPTSARMFADWMARSGRCINCRVAQLVEQQSFKSVMKRPGRVEECKGKPLQAGNSYAANRGCWTMATSLVVGGSNPPTVTKTFVCETPAAMLVNSDFIIFDLRCLINYHQPRREARLFFTKIINH